ncbi:MAG: ankyrin repeat domain-containing protein, partial [Halieaceae bacterium]
MDATKHRTWRVLLHETLDPLNNIDELDNAGLALVHRLCLDGNHKDLKIALQKNCCPNARTHDGLTPLQLIASRCNPTPSHCQCLRVLLQNPRTNINATSVIEAYKGHTPWNTALHMACDFAKTPYLRPMIAAGADPHLTNWKGLTPQAIANSK